MTPRSHCRHYRALAVTFTVVAVAAASTLPAAAGPAARPQRAAASSYAWHITPTGSSDEFRGLSVVSERTVWVSGEAGTVLRTTDGGATWQDVSPPAAAGMALRDIEAFSRNRAVALAIGTGEDSRIYATRNGGRTWMETFRNPDPNAFYDCMAFSPDGSGLAMSDPVGGYFQLARTTDRGQSWQVFTPASMPAALDGEFGFAASGTCIVSQPGHRYWFASGGVAQPRVFRSKDGGEHWTVTAAPMRGGPNAGIFSLAFRSAHEGVAVGGDYTDDTNGTDAAATTRSGGRHWQASGPLGGYRSGVAYIPVAPRTLVAVGPTGSDVSTDGGHTWTTFDGDRYDGIQCRPRACWASGTDGRVAVLERSGGTT
ncbi:MAG: YCF48-related protein [Nocardioidaceae bacterium]